MGETLEFDGAVFEGRAGFYHLKCAGQVSFSGATFKAGANFNSINCGDSAFFNSATFEGEADFGGATVGRQLSCQGAAFKQYVDLYKTNMGTLAVGNELPLREDSKVDLRECRFERFDGTPKVARALAKSQRPGEFSRDPYIQLEKYYSSVGNELEAKRFHFRGRSEQRKNAFRRGNKSTKWPLPTKVSNVSLWVLTGYGVQTWRLFLFILAFIALGTYVFWGENALSDTAQISGSSQPDVALQISTQSNQQQQQLEEFWPHLFERASYSLDLFLPVVNLHIDENWRPSSTRLELYAVGHGMIGWGLVPLLLTSLTGIIRRE